MEILCSRFLHGHIGNCQEKILDRDILLLYSSRGVSGRTLFFTEKEEKIMSQDVNKVEKIVEQGLLYDFYGELLTEHQKNIYEAAILEDYSLSEIAEMYGISRQGVHDLVKRCDKILLQYEEKLKLVHKFTLTKELVSQIEELSGKSQGTDSEKNLKKIHLLAENIMKEL